MTISTHVKRTITLSALLLLVMVKFQNCGQSPQIAAFSGEQDGQVRIVDRWTESQIAFVNSNQKISPSESNVMIQGLCVGSDKTQQIEYQILSISDSIEVVDQGVVDCVMGGFELSIQPIYFQSCSEKIQIRATRAGDELNIAETILTPDC